MGRKTGWGWGGMHFVFDRECVEYIHNNRKEGREVVRLWGADCINMETEE